MVVKEIVRTNKFEREAKSIKNKSLLAKIKKQILKIVENPEIGKPLKYEFKGERTVYVKPYRIIYSFFDEKLYLLRFEHRKDVYSR